MPGSDSGRPYDRRLAVLRLAVVYAFVGALLWLSRPTAAGVALGALLIAAGEALRVWAAGHLVKNFELVTSGPYRRTRNPLYLGRLLILGGLCVMCRLPLGANWAALAGGLAVFFGYYLPRKERVEPARLRELHGDAFERYRRAVPALWPSLSPFPEGAGRRWCGRRALANREHWMVLALAAIVSVMAWRARSG